jgi:hypothetical protein
VDCTGWSTTEEYIDIIVIKNTFNIFNIDYVSISNILKNTFNI